MSNETETPISNNQFRDATKMVHPIMNCQLCEESQGHGHECKGPWRNLGPDEVIQERDEQKRMSSWYPVALHHVGNLKKNYASLFRTRRPLPEEIKTETETPRTEVCPHCGAKAWEEDTGYSCGSEYLDIEGEGSPLLRTATCYANQNSQLKAEVERLKERLYECLAALQEVDKSCPWGHADELADAAFGRLKRLARAAIAEATNQPTSNE